MKVLKINYKISDYIILIDKFTNIYIPAYELIILLWTCRIPWTKKTRYNIDYQKISLILVKRK